MLSYLCCSLRLRWASEHYGITAGQAVASGTGRRITKSPDRRCNRRATLVVGAFILTYPLPYYLVQSYSRYAYPTEWAITLLAAFGALGVAKKLLRRQSPLGSDRLHDHANCGKGYSRKDDAQPCEIMRK